MATELEHGCALVCSLERRNSHYKLGKIEQSLVRMSHSGCEQFSCCCLSGHHLAQMDHFNPQPKIVTGPVKLHAPFSFKLNMLYFNIREQDTVQYLIHPLYIPFKLFSSTVYVINCDVIDGCQDQSLNNLKLSSGCFSSSQSLIHHPLGSHQGELRSVMSVVCVWGVCEYSLLASI